MMFALNTVILLNFIYFGHVMKNKKNQTTFATPSTVDHNWFIIDASGKTLGRLSSEIAKVLRGKHKPSYTPHIDCGDGVIVVNAEKVVVTGRKRTNKIYRRYTGYMGGLRETTYETMSQKKPEYIIEHAVKGMVPRTRQGRRQMKRLKVFKGPEHTMQAQQPVAVG